MHRKPILNFRYLVGPSSLPGGGMGLFCGAKPIAKGTYIFTAFARGDFSAHNENNRVFEQHFFQCYPNNFVNHSDNPNTINMWVGDLYIMKKAIRTIGPGEEIFSDYNHGMRIVREKGYLINDWLKFKKD